LTNKLYFQIGLVDYEGDSDEEETEEHEEEDGGVVESSPSSAEDPEKLEPVTKRPRLT
jgi:hypothetical protein